MQKNDKSIIRPRSLGTLAILTLGLMKDNGTMNW